MASGNKIIPKTGLHERETNALSIHENFSWTFAGNVVYAGSQWGILVVLAKLGIDLARTLAATASNQSAGNRPII